MAVYKYSLYVYILPEIYNIIKNSMLWMVFMPVNKSCSSDENAFWQTDMFW